MYMIPVHVGIMALMYVYTYMYMHGFLQDFKLEEDFERDNPGLTEALHTSWEYAPINFWCIQVRIVHFH